VSANHPNSRAPFVLEQDMMKLASGLLLAAIEEILAGRARDVDAWLSSTAAANSVDTFATAFAGASRHVGRGALALSPDELGRLRGVGLTWPVSRWAVDDLARAAVFLKAGDELAPSAYITLVHECYRDGDTRQRQAVLRALPLLGDRERFLAIAIDASRAGIAPLFEAIACENPYPSAYFPALTFNQMVLQAIIHGVSLDRVVGLAARVTPELVRVANEYAAERRAAGRLVSADLDSITRAASAAA
jgi:hypothetical protein